MYQYSTIRSTSHQQLQPIKSQRSRLTSANFPLFNRTNLRQSKDVSSYANFPSFEGEQTDHIIIRYSVRIISLLNFSLATIRILQTE